MKAAFQDQFGTPQVLRVQEVKAPHLADNQILIQVHASSVTQGDRRLRAADYPGLSSVVGRLMFGVFRPRNPIPGTNFAGRVIAVGERVTRFSVGDDVFGGCDHSACAELLALSQDASVAKLPKGIGYAEASAVPYGAVTALTFLRDLAKVQPGERVLVIGASGGVGRFAVQVARYLGAEVTGVCSAAKQAMVRQLGAHEVIDYDSERYLDGSKTYDVIFDTHSGDGFGRAKLSLTTEGRFVTLFMTVRVLLQMLLSSLRKGPRVLSGVALGNARLMEDVGELLASEAIWPVVGQCYPLAEVSEAHAALETRGHSGAVVVCIGDAARAA